MKKTIVTLTSLIVLLFGCSINVCATELNDESVDVSQELVDITDVSEEEFLDIDSENETLSVAGERNTLTIQGYIQEGLEKTYISYAIFTANGEEENVYSEGYLTPESNHRAQISLESGKNYFIVFGTLDNDKYHAYSLYMGSTFDMTSHTYYDFLFGDEKFIAENQSSLSGGRTQAKGRVLDEQIAAIDDEDYLIENQPETLDKSEIKKQNTVAIIIKIIIIAAVIIIPILIIWGIHNERKRI